MWNHVLSQLEEKLMNLKPFCLLFDSSLAVQQTNTYSGNSALLKFQCLLLFFSEQHPILLDRNGVHNRDVWKEGQCTRNRKLAAIMCSWNMWRLWMTISAVEREQGLSLIDDWRHCYRCSWLKRRGATSMERGQVVFPARDCADVPFPLLKLNTYSNRFMSRATSPLLLSTSFWS
jgi:hypothetical protein